MQKDRKKELMTIRNFEELTPPYPEYKYFADSEAFAFRPDANIFDMVNAWWLIDAATLAYAQEPFATSEFNKAGFDRVKFIRGRERDTECYVASNDQFAIVAFRGTESWPREGDNSLKHIFADIKTDLELGLVVSGQGGKVHKGFKKALDEIADELFKYLKDIHEKDFKVWVTGHSLGAALATLMADRYGTVQGLYTFGSPRVGDNDFKEDFEVNTHRFVNNNDIVPKIPTDGPYKHVGSLKYIDSQGIVHDNISKWKRFADESRGAVQHLFNSVGKLRQGFFQGFIPDPIIDHVPVHYATHIWNNIY